MGYLRVVPSRVTCSVMAGGCLYTLVSCPLSHLDGRDSGSRGTEEGFLPPAGLSPLHLGLCQASLLPESLASRPGKAGLQARGSAEEADQGPRDSCGERLCLGSWRAQVDFLEGKESSRGPSLKAKNKSGF